MTFPILFGSRLTCFDASIVANRNNCAAEHTLAVPGGVSGRTLVDDAESGGRMRRIVTRLKQNASIVGCLLGD